MLGDAFKQAGISSKDFKKKKNIQKEKPKQVTKTKEIVQKSTIKFKKDGILKLKLTAISPLHIGSGEVYEPTNFVIDGNILYHFKDEDFFLALDEQQKDSFMRIIDENRSDSFSRINKFVKDNIEVSKKIAFLKVKTTEALQKDYNQKIGKISQIEGHSGNYTKVFNKFEIQRIQRKQLKSKDFTYSYLGYITGSSLKGAISTAYREFIYKNDGKQALEIKFENKDVTKNIFKDLKISDAKVIKIGTKIGYACNKERFEDDETGMSTFIETINPNSEFIVDISYHNLKMQDILNSLNEHYIPIFKSMLLNETDGKEEFINEYLADSFYEKYKNFIPKENQFLLRVGKHCGARAVTIDGLRDISVKESKYKTLKHQKEETTTWLFGESSNSSTNLLPFGWVLCEVIE